MRVQPESWWFIDPVIVLDIYTKRSDVIHGSDLQLCGKADYHELRVLTIRTISQVIELVGKNPHLKKHSQIIRFMDESPMLTNAIAWLQTDGRPKAAKIATFGKGLQRAKV